MEGCVYWKITSNILFLPLPLGTQKGECGLPHTTEGSPTQTPQHGDRGCIDAEHQADPFGLLPALIHSLVPSIQTLVQPPKSQQVPLRILRRARKPGHHSLVGGKSVQVHYLEPGSLPGHQGRYPGSQPILGHFIVADHNSRPSSPIGINQPGW